MKISFIPTDDWVRPMKHFVLENMFKHLKCILKLKKIKILYGKCIYIIYIYVECIYGGGGGEANQVNISRVL